MLVSPDNNVVVSIGFGREGDLNGAIDELRRLVKSSFKVLGMSAPREAKINSLDAMTVTGRVENDEGAILSLALYAIGADGANLAITVFTGEDSGRRAARTVEEIVNSVNLAATG
ncbi:MAG: hypothetical protein QOG04_2236 [Actinomycetota bacterium]|nr:hypothetical protein [Actinomycetota bacterium]